MVAAPCGLNLNVQKCIPANLQPKIQEEWKDIREQSRLEQHRKRLEELPVIINVDAFDILKQGAKVYNPKVQERISLVAK